MPSAAPVKIQKLSVRNDSGYLALREKVRATLLEGRRRIEQEKVRTYWETGRHIHEHLLSHQERAKYGDELLIRLAEDLEIDESILKRAVKFARLYPKGAARHLSWAHYRALIAVPDEAKRRELTDKAAKEEWTSRELQVEVRNHSWAERVAKNEKSKVARLPLVCLGPFYTYQIVEPDRVSGRSKEGDLRLDLGFSHKTSTDVFPEVNFKAGSIVTSIKKARGPKAAGFYYSMVKAEGATEESLYTYKAFVAQVVDGDTLKVEIQLGFGQYKTETIRLNYIDCPELGTPEGEAARKFVEAELKSCDFITVKSIKTRKEKWGRYLGDVFYKPAPDSKISAGSTRHTSAGYQTHSRKNLVISTEGRNPGFIYLNQLLLDKRHAVKVRM